ncbi:sensor domain-containing protein [Chloroflexota bacterium]
MSTSKQRGFFGVIVDPQSYRNILYLLIAFPLGTFYFVYLVTGLSTGFGMIVTLVGIPILLLVLGGSWALCGFERKLAIALLKEDIPEACIRPTSEGLWSKVKALLNNRVTWTGMLYLLLKFPIGIVTFTVAVTLISLSVSLSTAPAWMWTNDRYTWGDWNYDPFTWSWIPVLIGIPLLFISLHAMNYMTAALGRLTREMLGKLSKD